MTQHDADSHTDSRPVVPDLAVPVIAAPMAGGPTTSALVVEMARVGAWGMLAGANKTVDAMASEIEQVRSADVPVGVNLFIPDEPTTDPSRLAQLAEYEARIGVTAQALDATPGKPVWDDDDYPAKVAWLVANPVDVVTFMFGIPDRDVVEQLHRCGTRVGVMVTRTSDAVDAVQRGADFLIIQGPDAGGHQAIVELRDGPNELPLLELFAEVKQTLPETPLIAAGGIATPADVRTLLDAGAVAVQVGTVLLRSRQAGSSATHRAALTDETFTETTLTRAFSGRFARSLTNAWTREFADAPACYPEVNRLAGPVRKAAAAAGEAQWTNLWAGTGWRRSQEAAPSGLLDGDAGDIARWLANVTANVTDNGTD